MQKTIVLFVVLFSLIGTNASAEDIKNETVSQVERYLNNLTTVTAKFTQIAPDGNIAEGVFYLQRPGKMRWEYDPPVPIVMVSNGDTLIYYDSELQQTNNIPIKETLAGFLVQKHIALRNSFIVDSVEQDAGMVRISLHQKASPDEGKLMLEFADVPFRLNSMMVTDATNQETRIAFSGAVFGQPINQNKFDLSGITNPRRTR